MVATSPCCTAEGIFASPGCRGWAIHQCETECPVWECVQRSGIAFYRATSLIQPMPPCVRTLPFAASKGVESRNGRGDGATIWTKRGRPHFV
eukprot:295600-Rhodomonas_salina.1